MNTNNTKFRAGLTLVELVIAMTASLIVVLTVGALLVSGHRSWNDAFEYANGNLQVNSLETMLAFGSVGRRSNKSDYRLYVSAGESYLPVLPSSMFDPEEVVFGDAVEFRYWDEELNADFMDADVTGNAYAFFYVDDGKLMVDRGPYPPGAVGPSGHKRHSSNSRVLAENVESIEFSHTTKNAAGDGKGCVKLSLRLYDPEEERSITVKTATLMRNVWP
ncbi:MAG: hypothetical protein JW715_05200 [Sedimentisphaerales bacterium]|nr:hypothetical protein [Sedimentisphaerales bacterium]